MNRNIKICISKDGDLLLDHYIKFENLQQSYVQFCNKIGIPSIVLPRLKTKIRSNVSKDNYDYFYTKESKLIVQERAKLYIEKFGYEFGDL